MVGIGSVATAIPVSRYLTYGSLTTIPKNITLFTDISFSFINILTQKYREIKHKTNIYIYFSSKE